MAALLPYDQIPPLDLGPISLQPFGILVAVGVLVGAWVARKRARQLGIDENPVRLMTGYLLVCGFLGAHLFDAIFYNWDKLAEDPVLLLRVWEGISSYGGFLGATAGFLLFIKLNKVHSTLAFADITIAGTLPGFTFGRLGCAVVYDHAGQPTDMWTGMDYPFTTVLGGQTRINETLHNLGFYEFCFLLVLIAATALVTRLGKSRPLGFIPGFVAVNYGVVRFFLDYLRYTETDPRYAGLTFAQWVSVVTVLVGVATLYRAFKGPAYTPPGGANWREIEEELEATSRDSPFSKAGQRKGGMGKAKSGGKKKPGNRKKGKKK